MKRKTLGVAVAVAVGMLSTSAFAMTQMANDSNKGSLLIYPRIEADRYEVNSVDGMGGGRDTLITLTNDSTQAVRLKCYYASSDEMATPFSGDPKKLKHKRDFTIDLTHNQPISWWAGSGDAVKSSGKLPDQVAPPFEYGAGELKCWAVTVTGDSELHYNHLYGTASLIDYRSMQAAEYTAVAFQAIGDQSLTGTALGSPGELLLDNVEYDGGPVMLLGNFQPYDFAGAKTRVTLASLNQDLRQNFTPTVTKLTWTFWNQDEMNRTGNHWCANSWFETTLPTIDSSYYSLGTASAYFRIQTTADTSICAGAKTSSYVGIIEQWNGVFSYHHMAPSEEMLRPEYDGFYRATGLTGRGKAAAANAGSIKWDTEPGDSFKK